MYIYKSINWYIIFNNIHTITGGILMKKKNQKIKCEVDSCKYNDSCKNCSLDEIKVSCNCGNPNCKDETICDSFEENKK